MSRRRPAQTRGVALIFGESENDTRALAELIQALCPQLTNRVVTRRRPLVLIRSSSPNDVGLRARKLAAAVRAEKVATPVVCVFAHEDADEVEPAHQTIAEKIERALHEAGCPAHAVVPAWEMESWLLLFPAALTAFRASWARTAIYRGRDVGRVQNSKEKLIRLTRKSGQEYRESDAPLVAKKIRELQIANIPEGTSRSYERFRAAVDECCAKMGS